MDMSLCVYLFCPLEAHSGGLLLYKLIWIKMLIQSSSMAPDEFIRTVLERDVRNIYRAQKLIVSERIWHEGKDLKTKDRGINVRVRTGRLEDALYFPDFIIQSQGETFNIIANYPLYIRFLDMKHIKDLRVYNRQIWGILYNNALKDIRFKYGKSIADKVGNALRESFPSFSRNTVGGFDTEAYSKAKGR